MCWLAAGISAHSFLQGTSREYIGPPSNALEAAISIICLFVGMGTSLIVVGAAVAAMDHLDEVMRSRAQNRTLCSHCALCFALL